MRQGGRPAGEPPGAPAQEIPRPPHAHVDPRLRQEIIISTYLRGCQRSPAATNGCDRRAAARGGGSGGPRSLPGLPHPPGLPCCGSGERGRWRARGRPSLQALAGIALPGGGVEPLRSIQCTHWSERMHEGYLRFGAMRRFRARGCACARAAEGMCRGDAKGTGEARLSHSGAHPGTTPRRESLMGGARAASGGGPAAWNSPAAALRAGRRQRQVGKGISPGWPHAR
jgi:hypothetical protein